MVKRNSFLSTDRTEKLPLSLLLAACGWILLYLWVALATEFALDSPLLQAPRPPVGSGEEAIVEFLGGWPGSALPALVLLTSIGLFVWRAWYKGDPGLPLAIEFLVITGFFFFLIIPIGALDSLLRDLINSPGVLGGGSEDTRWWRFLAFEGLRVAAVLALQASGALSGWMQNVMSNEQAEQ